MYFAYKPPHNAKFNGVKNVADKVANAVKLTDNSTFPLAKDEIKLDIFPPGHDAINIIPIAIEAGGFNSIITINVNEGNKRNCEKHLE